MQLRAKDSKIHSMQLNKTAKISITVFLILLVISLLGFLFIYPSFNKISLIFEDLNPYRTSKNIYIDFLSRIAPTLEKFEIKVFAANSIEESIGKDFVLDQKVLENSHANLTINSSNISGRISEGVTSDAMMKGFWHFPTSAFPGQKGNMVVIGHRFQYLPPAQNTFFNLDKVKIGDSIVVTLDEGSYTYIVTNIQIVEPNDISILQKTDDYRLTLITCTPLWTSEQRLVITAKLDKLYKKV
jgi:sortase A